MYISYYGFYFQLVMKCIFGVFNTLIYIAYNFDTFIFNAIIKKYTKSFFIFICKKITIKS